MGDVLILLCYVFNFHDLSWENTLCDGLSFLAVFTYSVCGLTSDAVLACDECVVCRSRRRRSTSAVRLRFCCMSSVALLKIRLALRNLIVFDEYVCTFFVCLVRQLIRSMGTGALPLNADRTRTKRDFHIMTQKTEFGLRSKRSRRFF